MCFGEVVPVEVGPLARAELFVDVGRGLGYGAGSEFADEAHLARKTSGVRREVGRRAVVPSEVEVAVGSAELGQVGHDAGVGDRDPARIGLLERPLDPVVEHGLVPRRELLTGEPPETTPAATTLEASGLATGVVVRRPQRDRRMVAQRVDGRSGLLDGPPADRSRLSPLQREVL